MRKCYNITLIGTVPQSAGKGLGRELIRLVLDRADREKVGVWVPTTYQPRVSLCTYCFYSGRLTLISVTVLRTDGI